MRRSRFYAFAVILIALAGRPASAAGGRVVPKADGSDEGGYFGLGGSGEDRFINEYSVGDYPAESILCGAIVRSLHQGNPPFGSMRVDIRPEDPSNPGYPDLAVAPIAVCDEESVSSCEGSRRQLLTFGRGQGIPSPATKHYLSAIEPVHGTTGTLDFCGILIDASSSYLGAAKYYSGGRFGALPWNIFVEEIVFDVNAMDLRVRASGSPRYPGDPGIRAVFTRRPHVGPGVTDDDISLAISIDNGTGGVSSRNLSVCVDATAIDPMKSLRPVTGYFRPVGGGPAIMNPIALPPGRTVLRLAIATEQVKAKIASVCDARAVSLPLDVLVDDPAVDLDPCRLEAIPSFGRADDERQVLGLRRRAGSSDDDSAESFFTARFPAPNQTGDAINVRFPAIDMPRVAYAITGFEVVGGEIGGSGLPGLDAIELRTADPVFTSAPDLSALGLLRSVGIADGVGEAPLGPASSTVVFDVADLAVAAPEESSGAANFFLVALLLPGESTVASAIGVDRSPVETVLGESTFTLSGLLPTYAVSGNAMLRLLLDGDRATLAERGAPATMSPSAVLRSEGYFIAIDRWGRRIE